MSYYFAKTIDSTFDDAITRTTDALKKYGFGVLTEIRMHEKLKEKVGVDIQKYTILGACNPPFAYKALLAENKIGTMLPCNVIVQEVGAGKVEVAAVNPIESMKAITNPALGEVALQVTDILRKMVEEL
jgi:uncharacterized protein (DUF302 family)